MRKTPFRDLLYNNSKITKDEATLLLIGYMAKNKLTRNASENLLKLLNFFLPTDTTISESIYALKKSIPCTTTVTSKHYYCQECETYIGKVGKGKSHQCEKCNATKTQAKLDLSASYFLIFSIKAQLEFMLRSKDLAVQLFEKLVQRNSSKQYNYPLKDIVDGKMYKGLELDQLDFSCCVNTDGVPVFKSSTFSIWPILISVNELNYRDRCKNTLVAALWFGAKKPNFEIFFEPFLNNCQNLSQTDTVSWYHNGTNFKSKVYFPIFVADSPARCSCQGTNQYNGKYGCSWCLEKGENFQLTQKSRKWVYPPNKQITLWQADQFKQHLFELSTLFGSVNNTKAHFGVKSASKLLLIPKFNIVNGFVFDVMHAAFLGVSRAFANIWLDSKYHGKSFYIGLKIKDINTRLAQIVVPEHFSRSVRLLDERKLWKASEWRTWTFVVPLLLESILPVPYLVHFSKYIKAMMLLSGEAIFEKDITESKVLLWEFVDGIRLLYGMEFCSFNCHSLLHAPGCVEDWGPLFSYSAFQFENFNGILLNLFNGANRIDAQISNRLNELICTINWSYAMEKSGAVKKKVS